VHYMCPTHAAGSCLVAGVDRDQPDARYLQHLISYAAVGVAPAAHGTALTGVTVLDSDVVSCGSACLRALAC
jgi:hypothetical protein